MRSPRHARGAYKLRLQTASGLPQRGRLGVPHPVQTDPGPRQSAGCNPPPRMRMLAANGFSLAGKFDGRFLAVASQNNVRRADQMGASEEAQIERDGVKTSRVRQGSGLLHGFSANQRPLWRWSNFHLAATPVTTSSLRASLCGHATSALNR